MRGSGSSTASSSTGRSTSVVAEAEVLGEPGRRLGARGVVRGPRPRSPSPSGCASSGGRAQSPWTGRRAYPLWCSHGHVRRPARPRPLGPGPGRMRAGARTTYEPDAGATRGRRRGDRRAARARLAEPRRAGGAAGRLRGDADGTRRSSSSPRAGRCGWSRATPRARSRRSCVARAADGRWLAGRRAAWVASWAGRWALGAGGAVEVGETPADTLVRELEEEWSVPPERLPVEALVCPPTGLVHARRPGLAARGRRERRPRRRARRVRLVAGRRRPAGPAEADEPLRMHGPRCCRRPDVLATR